MLPALKMCKVHIFILVSATFALLQASAQVIESKDAETRVLGMGLAGTAAMVGATKLAAGTMLLPALGGAVGLGGVNAFGANGMAFPMQQGGYSASMMYPMMQGGYAGGMNYNYMQGGYTGGVMYPGYQQGMYPLQGGMMYPMQQQYMPQQQWIQQQQQWIQQQPPQVIQVPSQPQYVQQPPQMIPVPSPPQYVPSPPQVIQLPPEVIYQQSPAVVEYIPGPVTYEYLPGEIIYQQLPPTFTYENYNVYEIPGIIDELGNVFIIETLPDGSTFLQYLPPELLARKLADGTHKPLTRADIKPAPGVELPKEPYSPSNPPTLSQESQLRHVRVKAYRPPGSKHPVDLTKKGLTPVTVPVSAAFANEINRPVEPKTEPAKFTEVKQIKVPVGAMEQLRAANKQVPVATREAMPVGLRQEPTMVRMRAPAPEQSPLYRPPIA